MTAKIVSSQSRYWSNHNRLHRNSNDTDYNDDSALLLRHHSNEIDRCRILSEWTLIYLFLTTRWYVYIHQLVKSDDDDLFWFWGHLDKTCFDRSCFVVHTYHDTYDVSVTQVFFLFFIFILYWLTFFCKSRNPLISLALSAQTKAGESTLGVTLLVVFISSSVTSVRDLYSYHLSLPSLTTILFLYDVILWSTLESWLFFPVARPDS